MKNVIKWQTNHLKQQMPGLYNFYFFATIYALLKSSSAVLDG